MTKHRVGQGKPHGSPHDFLFPAYTKTNTRRDSLKYSLKTIELISFITASLLGVVFHFIYGWSGENGVAGLFFPVNESTWEHLKLIFFPILLVSIGEYFIFHTRYDNFICVNILIYFLSMAAAYRYSCRALTGRKGTRFPSTVCYWGFVALCFVFFIFSLFPPHIGLFASPV